MELADDAMADKSSCKRIDVIFALIWGIFDLET